MNELNNIPNTSTPVILPAKRRRGRPRKDGTVVKRGEWSLQSPARPASDGMKTIHPNESKPNDRGQAMIGKIVSGVIDGCFDAGYFLSVRIGNNGPPLRGVIFKTGRITPVSSENDVAPNLKLYQISDLPIPVPNPQSQGNGISSQLDMQPYNVVCSQVLPSKPQSTASSFMFEKQTSFANVPLANVPMNNSSSSLVEKIRMQQIQNFNYMNNVQPIAPAQNLRLVEQDEMMQVYEVSVQSEGLMEDAIVSVKDWMPESSAKMHQGLSPEQCAIVHNSPAIGQQSVGKEIPSSSSDVKQNRLAYGELKDSFHDLHRSSLIAEDQPVSQEPLVMDGRRFQPSGMVQNVSQVRNLDLPETPIVDQMPSVQSANQNVDPEVHKNPIAEKLPSIPVNPGNMEAEFDSSKLDHYDLERQNFGILRDLVAGNHHFLPPEAISDQPGKLVVENLNSWKRDTEKGPELEHNAKVLGNNENSDIREAVSDRTHGNELHSQTARRTREALPFDLEFAAEESPCSVGPEIHGSSPAAGNPASLPESDIRQWGFHKKMN